MSRLASPLHSLVADPAARNAGLILLILVSRSCWLDSRRDSPGRVRNAWRRVPPGGLGFTSAKIP